jgi:hypothetical protein
VWNNISVNVFAELIASAIIFTVFAVIGSIIVAGRRRKLHKFFGISKDKKLTVYLSSMIAEPGSIKDRFGRESEHKGIVLSNYEFQVIPRITRLFSSNPIDNLPEPIAKLLENNNWLERPELTFLASPLEEKDIVFSNLITVGSGLFNSVTEYYLRTGSPILTLIHERNNESTSWVLKVNQGNLAGKEIRPQDLIGDDDEDKWSLGILVKLRDVDKKNCVFIAAGTNVNATRATIEYLVNNWHRLQKLYEDEAFGIALKCIKYHKDTKGFEDMTEILKIP